MARYRSKKQTYEDRASDYGMKVASYDPKNLEKEYRRLAKQADQRLVRLEAQARTKGFENILSYSYSSAMYAIKSFSGENAKRFNTKPPEDKATMIAKMNSMVQFLNSVTSTTKGIKAVYKKTAETLNSKYKTKFTWQDMSELVDMGFGDWSSFGSDTVMDVLGKITTGDKEMLKKLGKAYDKTETIKRGKETSKQVFKDLMSGDINIKDLI